MPSASALHRPEPAPTPRKGMIWIPGGALVAGTPPERLPRIADQEMAGEQVILRPFYIDTFPYPNEEGAIALTNVTHAEAHALCAEQDKRLCSELEWERACKGPENFTYEYGDVYRADRCATGTAPALRPTGLRVSCRSDFGVHDLHGGVWEWTASAWGRGNEGDAVSVRGGNGVSGELVGRCANARAVAPSTKSELIGFRCCAGPENPAVVEVRLSRGKKLELQDPPDKALGRALAPLLPEQARLDLGRIEELKLERQWHWRPLANDDLVVFGACTGIARDPRCGAIVARAAIGKPQVVAWAASGQFFPALQIELDSRNLWVYGGDDRGRFRRLVGYAYGRVSVGPPDYKMPKPATTTVKKRRK